jgi:hypothetical protein
MRCISYPNYLLYLKMGTYMVKTLRITSFIFIVAVLAICFFAFPVVYNNVKGDPKIKELLKDTDVLGKFKAANNNSKTAKVSQVFPLVQQAQAFALYLTPPVVKPVPAISNVNPAPVVAVPADVTPKIKILGTNYNQSNPELSLALIDEPGSGRRWVKQSGKVGYFTLQQVKDGSVVVSNGQDTFELKVDKQVAAATPTTPATKTAVKSVSPSLSKPAATPETKPAAAPAAPLPKPAAPSAASAQPNFPSTGSGGLDALIQQLKLANSSGDPEKAKTIQSVIDRIKAAQLNPDESDIVKSIDKALGYNPNEPNTQGN